MSWYDGGKAHPEDQEDPPCLVVLVSRDLRCLPSLPEVLEQKLEKEQEIGRREREEEEEEEEV